MTPNSRAALLMIGSMAGFTFNDTCIKLVGAQMPLFQLITIRGVMASLLIWLLALRMGALRFDLSRRDWILVGLRAVSETVATYFFLTALMAMPLANVTAVLQILPLMVTLGAALFFGESVGWRRYSAIAVGFAGMLMIVRPGPDGFSIYAIYALAAVVCVTFRDLSTKWMSPEVPSLTVSLISAVSVLCFAAVASLGTPWQAVSAVEAGLLAASAIFIMVGYLLGILVMRVGEASYSAPFRYTGLLWALLLGWLVFGDWPDNLTLAGAGVVVLSGLFALHRERVTS